MGVSREKKEGFWTAREARGWVRHCSRQIVCSGRGAVEGWQVQEGLCQAGQGLECQVETSGWLAVVLRCLVLAVG